MDKEPQIVIQICAGFALEIFLSSSCGFSSFEGYFVFCFGQAWRSLFLLVEYAQRLCRIKDEEPPKFDLLWHFQEKFCSLDHSSAGKVCREMHAHLPSTDEGQGVKSF